MKATHWHVDAQQAWLRPVNGGGPFGLVLLAAAAAVAKGLMVVDAPWPVRWGFVTLLGLPGALLAFYAWRPRRFDRDLGLWWSGYGRQAPAGAQALSEISHLELERSKSSDTRNAWRLLLVDHTGRRHPLVFYGPGPQAEQDAQAVAGFLNRPLRRTA